MSEAPTTSIAASAPALGDRPEQGTVYVFEGGWSVIEPTKADVTYLAVTNPAIPDLTFRLLVRELRRFAHGEIADADELCSAEAIDGFRCTRNPAHTGRHLAGDGSYVVAVWP